MERPASVPADRMHASGGGSPSDEGFDKFSTFEAKPVSLVGGPGGRKGGAKTAWGKVEKKAKYNRPGRYTGMVTSFDVHIQNKIKYRMCIPLPKSSFKF